MERQYLDFVNSETGTKREFYRGVIRGGDIATADYVMQPYLSDLLSRTNRTALAQFRCSSHRLGVEVGRWARCRRAEPSDGSSSGESASPSTRRSPRNHSSPVQPDSASNGLATPTATRTSGVLQALPRQQRACRLCNSGAVEDEEHMVFHCSHPALQAVRANYPDLQEALHGGSLSEFLQQPAALVASFIRRCMEAGDYAALPIYNTTA
jgi:hypothetical protein